MSCRVYRHPDKEGDDRIAEPSGHDRRIVGDAKRRDQQYNEKRGHREGKGLGHPEGHGKEQDAKTGFPLGRQGNHLSVPNERGRARQRVDRKHETDRNRDRHDAPIRRRRR